MTEATPPKSPRQLLERFTTREEKLKRIRAIERELEKMETQDEMSDPELLRGHIRFTRGFRYGIGVLLLCFSLMSATVYRDGHGWAIVLAVISCLAGVWFILRGVSFRPVAEEIVEGYYPNRKKPEYRLLVGELGTLARALAQDLQAEDEAEDLA